MAWLLLLPVLIYFLVGLVYAIFLITTTGMPAKEIASVIVFGPLSLLSLIATVKKGKRVKLG